MIIYQGQPCRPYPYLFTEKKENLPSLKYEFSNQFIYSDQEDARIALSRSINFIHPETIDLPRKLKDIEDSIFFSSPIKKYDYPDNQNLDYKIVEDYVVWEQSKEIDYLFGLFSSSFLENFEKHRKPEDFSFTMIDHPIKQIINLYYYFKGGTKKINKIKIIKESKGDIKKKNIKEYLEDLNNLSKFENIKENLKFYLLFKKIKYSQEEKVSKEELINFYKGVSTYSEKLIQSISPYLESLEKWIDFILETKTIVPIKNIDARIKNQVNINDIFFHCSKLYKKHNFYGIIDSKENLLESVKIITRLNETSELIYDGDYYFEWKDFPITSYRVKELEKLLEEDIEFFEEKKKAFYSYERS